MTWLVAAHELLASFDLAAATPSEIVRKIPQIFAGGCHFTLCSAGNVHGPRFGASLPREKGIIPIRLFSELNNLIRR